MKKQLIQHWPEIVVLAAPLVYLAVVWPQIPERVPVHFNIHFRPDNHMSRLPGTLLLPVTSLLITVATLVWFKFDPKMANYEPDTRDQVRNVLRKAMLAVNTLLGALTVGIVFASWGNLEVVKASIFYGVPLLFLFLGNYFGKLRRNYTIGIRCPWTLESPEVWNRTHRFAGRILVGISLLLIILKLSGLGSVPYFWTLLALLLGWSALALGYAFITSRKLHSQTIPK